MKLVHDVKLEIMLLDALSLRAVKLEVMLLDASASILLNAILLSLVYCFTLLFKISNVQVYLYLKKDELVQIGFNFSKDLYSFLFPRGLLASKFLWEKGIQTNHMCICACKSALKSFGARLVQKWVWKESGLSW